LFSAGQGQILLRAARSLAAARGGLDSTFPLALQLLMALCERAHRAVQVPRKTPRHLAFAFPLLNGEGSNFFSSTIFEEICICVVNDFSNK